MDIIDCFSSLITRTYTETKVLYRSSSQSPLRPPGSGGVWCARSDAKIVDFPTQRLLGGGKDRDIILAVAKPVSVDTAGVDVGWVVELGGEGFVVKVL